MSRIDKVRSGKCGITDKTIQDLSGHSMRVGAAQDMITFGMSVLPIMRAGGWKTVHVVARYVEHADLEELWVNFLFGREARSTPAARFTQVFGQPQHDVARVAAFVADGSARDFSFRDEGADVVFRGVGVERDFRPFRRAGALPCCGAAVAAACRAWRNRCWRV